MAGIREGDLRLYYTRHFPLAKIRDWLQYKDGDVPQEPESRRECAFWFDESRFTRWCTIDRMESLIGSVTTSPPERMEIGPVYTHDVRDHVKIPSDIFRAVHRELVFDIDADDFKDIKTCCGASEICERCWIYMECALDCLITVLSRNLGFRHILPVFSGRRGVHVWVCDKRARELSGQVREKIVDYLNLSGIVNGPHFRPEFCPLVQQMIRSCDPYFVRIAPEQGVFTADQLQQRVRSLLGREYYDMVQEALRTTRGSFAEKWERVKHTKTEGKTEFVTKPAYYRLVFSFTFPRLDAHVTTTMNHLLKSPFSYHPKSGFISVPILRDLRGTFPHHWAPKLLQLIAGDEDTTTRFQEAKDNFDAFVEMTVGRGPPKSPFL
jgi:DNA primase small subunit